MKGASACVRGPRARLAVGERHARGGADRAERAVAQRGDGRGRARSRALPRALAQAQARRRAPSRHIFALRHAVLVAASHVFEMRAPASAARESQQVSKRVCVCVSMLSRQSGSILARIASWHGGHSELAPPLHARGASSLWVFQGQWMVLPGSLLQAIAKRLPGSELHGPATPCLVTAVRPTSATW